eukprot:8626301-Prorocentrum_lima.AAC.1
MPRHQDAHQPHIGRAAGQEPAVSTRRPPRMHHQMQAALGIEPLPHHAVRHHHFTHRHRRQVLVQHTLDQLRRVHRQAT